MLKIYSGRDEFYQWDLDQKLIVDEPTATEVHFCNGLRDCSLVCEVFEEDGQRVVNVPNILFTTSLPFKAYLYDGCCTKQETKFKVNRRSKPDNYVYTETEIKTWDDLYERMAELELGSTAIIEVAELPVEDINDSLLYRTTDGVYWYAEGWHELTDESDLEKALEGKQDIIVFDGEYNPETNKAATVQTIINKVAELIAGAPEDFDTLKELADWLSTHGGEAAEMNSAIKQNTDDISAINEGLTEYVKNTDIAQNRGEAGLIRWNSAHGWMMTPDGFLYLQRFGRTQIDARKTYCWLDCSNVDDIVASGLTTNKLTLTDEEKASALAWLGAVGKTEYAGEGKAGLIKTSNAAGGCTVQADGTLYFYGIQDAEWMLRNQYYNGNRHLRLSHVDNIVKYGITTNSQTLTDDEKTAALKWLGAVSDTDVEYTCNKYNHQAIIEGYLADKYGFASGEIITEEELSKCEIDVEYGAYDGSHEGTLSLEGARVITLEGGYALSVAASYGCPDARVIVVTDTEAFNRTCGCDLESTGIYLSYTQVDNDAMQVTLTTKVKALRTTAPKVSNDYLYLEGNPVIKALMTRIEALENK